MYSKQTTLVNASGLHARPASEFVTKAKTYQCKVSVRNASEPDSQPVNAKSIVKLLAQGLSAGTLVEVIGDGEDEVEAVDDLIALIDSGFGE